MVRIRADERHHARESDIKTLTKMSTPVANCDQLSQEGIIANCNNLPHNALEMRILTIRGIQVMLNRDLSRSLAMQSD